MSKKLILAVVAVLFIGAAVFISVSGNAAEFPSSLSIRQGRASTTAIALSAGTSKRIIATSTFETANTLIPQTFGRMALTLQPVNCGSVAHVWLQFNDVAATTATGYSLAASSTITFSDDVPMAYGSIQALAEDANCTLLVTEWRSEN